MKIKKGLELAVFEVFEKKRGVPIFRIEIGRDGKIGGFFKKKDGGGGDGIPYFHTN